MSFGDMPKLLDLLAMKGSCSCNWSDNESSGGVVSLPGEETLAVSKVVLDDVCVPKSVRGGVVESEVVSSFR